MIWNYIIPLTLAYSLPCLLWFALYQWKPTFWPKTIIEKPDKPGRELVWSFVVVVLVLAIGQLYQAGILIPELHPSKVVKLLTWWLNNLLIFSPVFVYLKLTRQKLNTVFLSLSGVHWKLLFGVVATLLGTEVYMLFNGGHVGQILVAGLRYENYRNFLPVFLEGVGLAFLFVRLKWKVGLKWAIAIPAILFSLAHLPRAFSNDTALEMVIADSFLTALITVVVFATTAKSRDIIWLGLLHYFLDIAIGAFG